MRRRARRAATPACPFQPGRAAFKARPTSPWHRTHPTISLSPPPTQAAATVALAPPHAIAGIAVPATPDHRSLLRLRHAFASTSRNQCSRQFIVVGLLRSGIPCRSELLLVEAWLHVGSPAPFPLPPSFLVHEHRTASPSIPSTSSHRAMAGDASPATTRAAAPPCTAAAGFPCSLAHATSTTGFARGWGARRSPSPGLRPHRRRDLGGPPPPLSCEAGSWGRLNHGGHCQP